MTSRLAIYIGEPVTFLTVPVASFFVDVFSRARDWPLYFLVPRWIGEALILLPLWAFGCAWGMLYLEWYWI